MRRAFLGMLTAIVLLGASGWLGVRAATAAAEREGYTLQVTYARITRPGLATPFAIEVMNPNGFDADVRLDVSSSFLEAFDENGLDPDPVSSSSDGTWTSWGFEPPEGTTLEVSFDARLEPAVQWKRDASVRLVVAGETITTVSFTMWVMP